MGKIITGILMILTLGGLGLWSFIDLTLAMSGRFHDKNGLPINVSRPINTALKIIPIILLSLVYFCLIALLVVLYGDYRFRSMDNAAQTAYQNVVKAEDAYYFRYHKYTNDWGELRNSMGLTMDNYVEYRDLIMRVDSSGCPCYEFKVKHRFLTYGYKYSSCPSVRQRVTIDYF
jgi:hypothetical protein